MSEEVMKPEYAAAVGLMMIDATDEMETVSGDSEKKSKKTKKSKDASGESWLQRILKNFK